ncbi:MAG TPA: site-specific integrase [Actinomycetota bacterium]|nr:site-specific integrase [Actinomycetota bacterium]
MGVSVVRAEDGHRLQGAGADVALANRFLDHLTTRAFSAATIRAYAYDLLNFGRFLAERGLRLGDVVPTDLFDYLEWQAETRSTAGAKVVRLSERRGAAPATMNRRIAAVRALFEYALQTGVRSDNPVPAARRASGLRPKRRGLLGHISPRRQRTGGRLVRQPSRLPESLDASEATAFIADLATHRDRAIALAMLLGGLRRELAPTPMSASSATTSSPHLSSCPRSKLSLPTPKHSKTTLRRGAGTPRWRDTLA